MKCRIAIALGLVIAACSGPGATGPVARIERFVDEPATELFRRAAILSRETAFTWDLTDPAEARSWRADVGRSSPESGTWLLGNEGQEIVLSRAADLGAADLHELEVELAGSRGDLDLCWGSRATGLSEDRCERCAPRKRLDRGQLYRCAVGRHPGWRGAVERLWLRIRPENGDRVQIRTLRGRQHRLRPRPFADAVGRSWLLVLDGSEHQEARAGFLAPPGVEIERRIDLPEEAFLRLGYGLEPGVRGAVTFRAEVRLPPGEASEAVLVRTLRSLDVRRGSGWHDAEVDLSPFAGRQVTLVLRTEAGEAFDPVHGLPLWAHPEVVGHTAAPAPPDVVLISADTLRPDRLSLYGHERPTSPRIDAWAESCGVTFETAVASSPWTLPSHTTLFTGLDALSHGVNHPVRVPASLTTLPELLRSAGYSTYAVTGGGYLSPNYGLSQGFDRFLRWGDHPRASGELEAGVRAARQILAAHRGNPLFLFLHTYETHTPYRARQPYLSDLRGEEAREYRWPVSERNRRWRPEEGFVLRRQWVWQTGERLHRGAPLKPRERALAKDFYDSGVAFLDDRVGGLLEELRSAGRARKALVILTSDHGESLGEHGLVGHTNLYDTDLLVPLVLALPGCEGAGRRVPTQVRSADVLPTVLDVVGVESPPGLDGASLLPLALGEEEGFPREAWSYAATTNYGVALRIDGRLKYIFNNTAWSPVFGREEILELPGETPIPKTDPELRRRLRERVRERLGQRPGNLILEFANVTSDRLEVVLRGDGISPERVKASDLPRPGLAWSGKGDLRCPVAPGTRFELVLEEPRPGELEVAVTLGESGRLREHAATLTLAPRTELHWRLVHEGGTWREDGGAGGGSWTGVAVRWQPLAEEAPAAGDPASEDPALLEQLRALGYV